MDRENGWDLSLRRSLMARQALACALSLSAETIFCYPLDTLKSKCQMTSRFEKLSYASFTPWNYSQYTREAGRPSEFLYRGILPHVLGRAPALAARFCTYHLVCAFHLDGLGEGEPMMWPEMISAGMLAGAAEAAVGTPFELLKTRLQVSTPILLLASSPGLSFAGAVASSHLSSSNNSRIHRLVDPWLPPQQQPQPAQGLVSVFRATVAQEGSSQLYRGFKASLARDVIFGGVFFPSWVALQQLGREIRALARGRDIREADLVAVPGPMEVTVSGALAAALAAAVSHPMDCTKTRTQATVLPLHVVRERSILGIQEGSHWWQSFIGLRAWERGGVLWRGLGLRATHQAMAAAILISCYHGALSLLIPTRLHLSNTR